MNITSPFTGSDFCCRRMGRPRVRAARSPQASLYDARFSKVSLVLLQLLKGNGHRLFKAFVFTDPRKRYFIRQVFLHRVLVYFDTGLKNTDSSLSDYVKHILYFGHEGHKASPSEHYLTVLSLPLFRKTVNNG